MTEYEKEKIRLLKEFYGLADEATGSWHRFVDAIEKISNNMEEGDSKHNPL